MKAELGHTDIPIYKAAIRLEVKQLKSHGKNPRVEQECIPYSKEGDEHLHYVRLIKLQPEQVFTMCRLDGNRYPCRAPTEEEVNAVIEDSNGE